MTKKGNRNRGHGYPGRYDQMKALMKTGSEPGAELREVAVPERGPDEVLIRVKATAICGTDIHIYTWDRYAQERIKPPMIFGHEGCGEVARIGSRVRGYARGAILEPMGVAINGLLKEDINNKTVAVFGLGPIGQFALAAAAFWGASSIFAVEPNAYRLDMARRVVP